LWLILSESKPLFVRETRPKMLLLLDIDGLSNSRVLLREPSPLILLRVYFISDKSTDGRELTACRPPMGTSLVGATLCEDGFREKFFTVPSALERKDEDPNCLVVSCGLLALGGLEYQLRLVEVRYEGYTNFVLSFSQGFSTDNSPASLSVSAGSPSGWSLS